MEIIGFDMGGTSTDVSRYAGSYEHVFESTTAGELGATSSFFMIGMRIKCEALLGRTPQAVAS